MTITISLIVIPIILTLVLLGIMFRPSRSSSNCFDLTPVFRLLWVIPMLVVWLVYFMVAYFLK
jgi:hypothetical protein